MSNSKDKNVSSKKKSGKKWKKIKAKQRGRYFDNTGKSRQQKLGQFKKSRQSMKQDEPQPGCSKDLTPPKRQAIPKRKLFQVSQLRICPRFGRSCAIF